MSDQPTRDGWFRGSDFPCEPAPSQREHVYRLVLLGPPGVGKGTQAELLCQRLQTCHLSTGDLFRSAQCHPDPSPAMAKALEAMRRGELVSDELVMSLVRERSDCLRCEGGFLLDGIPRTVQQAETLQLLLRELNVRLDAVISYELPLEQIVDRIGGRRTCSDCRTVYHLTARPPRQPGVCDQCGGSLFQREDDQSETVRVRMQSYLEATQPLTDFYAQRDNLVCVSADGEPAEILELTLKALDEHLSSKSARPEV